LVSATTHNVFPVERPGDGNFQGTISRDRLAVLFHKKAFGAEMEAGNIDVIQHGECAGEGVSPSRPTSPLSRNSSPTRGSYIPSITEEEGGSGTRTPTMATTHAGLDVHVTVDGFDLNVGEGGVEGVEQKILFENAVVTNLLSPLVPWEKLEGDYPHYPNIRDNAPEPIDRSKVIDLRPYINTSPATIHESASVSKAYVFFSSILVDHISSSSPVPSDHITPPSYLGTPCSEASGCGTCAWSITSMCAWA
jgi:hypothetical protein